MAIAATSKPLTGPLVPPAAGDVIGGKYSVLHLMAEGGMAWVVAAKHVALDEIVALKILKPEFAAQSEVVGRFAREAKAAMQIRSEHSVKIMDVGADAKRGPFLVMDHLEGCDLASVLEKTGKISVRRAVDIALQTCDALAHAHTIGIVHRDIKPENVFIVRQGDLDIVRVLDFGISKATMTGRVFDTDLSVIKTQSLMGSPVYMSPEQMRGRDVDHRVDIWSLGALLYESVSGNVAFSGISVTEICALVLETEPAPLPADVSPAFADVILKCLRKDPADRYQNVGELALALMPFGPSRSRVWAERVVALLRAHGADLDDSIFKSIPPPSLSGPPSSSTRPLTTRPSASDSFPMKISVDVPAALPSPVAETPALEARATAPSLQRGGASRKPLVLIALAALGILLLVGAAVLIMRRSPQSATTPTESVATVGTSARPILPAAEPPPGEQATPTAVPATASAGHLGGAPRAGGAPLTAKPASGAATVKPLAVKPSASASGGTTAPAVPRQETAPAARATIVDDAPRAKIVE